MTDLQELTALDQAAEIRSGVISPVELVDHYLARIEKIDERVGAFITVTANAARAQAKAAEQRVRAGDDLPPLHGVPTAIKDVADTAGVPTTYGSRAFADHVPAEDAYSVARLRAAGAISLGKTNTPEFALSPYSDNDLGRSSRTPWDSTRTAGGSSGGAAAAVAAGLIPIAHANDGGGSIRIPASACGVGTSGTSSRPAWSPRQPERCTVCESIGACGYTGREPELSLFLRNPTTRVTTAPPTPPPTS